MSTPTGLRPFAPRSTSCGRNLMTNTDRPLRESSHNPVGVAVVLARQLNVVPQSRDNVGLWDGAPLGLILRSPWEMLQFACSTEYFPLTLTPSLGELGEREQQASDWCLADGSWANSGAGVIERRWTFLPLPKGEGRDEGKPSLAHPNVQSVAVRGPGARRQASHV